jgi:CubicO group peptidase (beta-lactamase class C family)
MRAKTRPNALPIVKTRGRASITLGLVLRLIAVLLISLPLFAADPLVGLWKARRWFEPDVRGTLVVQREGDAFTADIAGRVLPMRVDAGKLSFALPNGEGSFRGKLDGNAITGYWLNPDASPVTLKSDGPNRWSGEVAPVEQTFTFFLLVQKNEDGSYGVVLNNPERDHGARLGVERLVVEGNVVKLIRKSGDPIIGTYDAANDVISLPFMSRGGTFDFRREGDESDFYARGKNPPRYAYRPPPLRDDGWTGSTLQQVNIDRAAVEKTIQHIIDTPMVSTDTPEVHALLVARRGKLVLEEYFHGEHRDRQHDTRSASKSFVTLIAGAAMQAGAPLSTSTPVYRVMNGGTFPEGLEPRKRAMTLEHLLTMTSGYQCDDWDENAAFTEDVMWDQEKEPDFYRWTLDLPMARDPGEKTVYCSPGANLAVGVVERAAGEHTLDLFDRLIARPMQIRRYTWPINRAGQAYGGGGVRVTARDFLKFGQLMLDGGMWNGRRILGRDFATRASSPLHPFDVFRYGYLWWSYDYPYGDRKVRGYHAGGLGGQAVVVFPELDLVVATFGANYSSAGNYYVQMEIIPKHLLPAVKE